MKTRHPNYYFLSNLIITYEPDFVESMIILRGYWFFMTSFSLFIHQNPQVDDRTDMSKVGYQEKVVVFIKRKTRLGKDFFELKYKFGFIELLATIGFFDLVSGSFFCPSLGSS